MIQEIYNDGKPRTPLSVCTLLDNTILIARENVGAVVITLEELLQIAIAAGIPIPVKSIRIHDDGTRTPGPILAPESPDRELPRRPIRVSR